VRARLARELEGLGLTGTDIASILEVSPQRVSQLLAR
jgi:predicted transcriptional regulator